MTFLLLSLTFFQLCFGVSSPKYKYSTDWTSPYTAIWMKHLSSFKEKENVKLLEVGVWEGRSAFWFLENILQGKGSSYTGVDIKEKENLLHNLKISPNREKFHLILGNSRDVLRTLKKESFDIIYIDGHHSAFSVITDIMNSWFLLKKNGIMILDDYQLLNDKKIPSFRLPKIAIDFFIYSNRNNIEVLHKEYQVILKKINNHDAPDAMKLSQNFYFYWPIYNPEYEGKVFKVDKDQKVHPYKSSKEEVRLLKELLLKIPQDTPYFPKNLKEESKYKTLYQKYQLPVSK